MIYRQFSIYLRKHDSRCQVYAWVVLSSVSGSFASLFERSNLNIELYDLVNIIL